MPVATVSRWLAVINAQSSRHDLSAFLTSFSKRDYNHTIKERLDGVICLSSRIGSALLELKGVEMFPHFLSRKTIFVLILCSGLVSCSVSTSAGKDSNPANVTEGSGSNQVEEGVVGGTISGGGEATFPNLVLLDYGVIGGGRDNSAGNFSTVGGGEGNHADGIRATVSGGANNTASRNNAVVAGGYGNTASQSFATIGGGNVNTADGSYTTISGGAGNLAIGRFSTISGGTRNQTPSAYSTVGGGWYNLAIGGTTTIGGGTGNRAPGIGSTIAGGAGNTAMGLQSAISGGLSNQVTDNYGAVSGGRQNVAGNANKDTEDSPYANVGGGYGNQAGGAYATIPGGYENQALGDYSFAAGDQAQVGSSHPGTFLFADSSGFVFPSVTSNEFAVRATGGVRFVTGLGADGEPLIGVRLAPGSGSWETLSDRNAKTAILPVDDRQVLDALMSIPISTWRYKGQSSAVQHIGPMAQDFYAAFGMGEDAHYIGTIDADGVALASIQGLYQVVQEKDAQIVALKQQNAKQEKRLDDFEARLSKLEKQDVQPSQPFRSWFAVLSLVAGLEFGKYLYSHRGVA